jgi:hypothetical protein
MGDEDGACPEYYDGTDQRDINTDRRGEDSGVDENGVPW